MGSLRAFIRVLVEVERVCVLFAVKLFVGLTVIIHHAAEVLKLALVVLLHLSLVVFGMFQLQVLVQTSLRPIEPAIRSE